MHIIHIFFHILFIYQIHISFLPQLSSSEKRSGLRLFYLVHPVNQIFHQRLADFLLPANHGTELTKQIPDFFFISPCFTGNPPRQGIVITVIFHIHLNIPPQALSKVNKLFAHKISMILL